MHEAVEEQLAANDPPEARAAYERLAALGYSDHDIAHTLADVLVREVWRAQKDHLEIDRARYAARLTAPPESSEGPEMASRDLEPARLGRKDRRRLERLPRTAAAWEVDLAELPIEVEGVGMPLCALWSNAADGTLRVFTRTSTPDRRGLCSIRSSAPHSVRRPALRGSRRGSARTRRSPRRFTGHSARSASP